MTGYNVLMQRLVVYLSFVLCLAATSFAQSNEVARPTINLAGTFNDWSPTNADYRMTFAGDQVYVLQKFFTAGHYKFKFTVDGDWTRHYGDGPGGLLTQPGADIKLDIKKHGQYTILLDLGAHHWKIEPASLDEPHPVLLLHSPVHIHLPITLDGSESVPRDGKEILSYEFGQDTNDVVKATLRHQDETSPKATVVLPRDGTYHFWLKVNDGIGGPSETITLKPQASYQIVGDWTAADPNDPATFLKQAGGTTYETILKSTAPGDQQLILIKNHDEGRIVSSLTVSITQTNKQFWRVSYDEKTRDFKCVPEQLVEFSYRPADDPVLQGRVEATSVNLAGTFNEWSGTATPMTDTGDGTYVADMKLDDGYYQYKFVVNGEGWMQDPNADPALRKEDGHGGFNSGIYIGQQGKDYGPPPKDDINMAAVRHKPQDPEFFNVLSSELVEIRLQTLQADATQVSLELLGKDRTASIPMQVAETAFGFDYWSASVFAGDLGKDITYYFRLVDGPTTRYCGLAEDKEAKLGIRPFTTELAAHLWTPDWAKNVVWYQMFPDRFRNGSRENDPPHTLPWRWDWYKCAPGEQWNETKKFSNNWYDRRFGGDFQGVIDRLPYFHDLGVTALYFCPVFEANSYHGYDTVDYRHISEYYGFKGDYEKVAPEETLDPKTWQWTPSDKLFLEFVKKAHAQGLKVILDGVFNHMGKRSFALRDVLANGVNSPYADWFDITDWGPPVKYKSWDGGGYMPNFRKDAEHGIASESARQYLFNIARRWMDPNGNGDTSAGIDGWRLDVAQDVPPAFWRDWRKLVKGINSNAYITGEDWGLEPQHLQGDEWDAVMNYQFAIRAVRYFIDQQHKISATEFDSQLRQLLESYPMQVDMVMQNLFDSHDTDRVVSMIANPDRDYKNCSRPEDGCPYNGAKPVADSYRVLKLMATFQMTFLGAPMIWYGDEAGMFGSDDPTDRKPMLWKDLEPYDNAQDIVMDDVLNHYERVIAIRNTYPALRTGLYHAYLLDDTKDLFGFTRTRGADVVAVIINNSARDQSSDIPVPFANDTHVIDVMTAPSEIYDATLTSLGFPAFEQGTKVRALRISAAAPSLIVRDGKVHLDLPKKSAAILVRR